MNEMINGMSRNNGMQGMGGMSQGQHGMRGEHEMYEHGGGGMHSHEGNGKKGIEDLKWLKQNMRGNIEEAKGFAMKANEMREKNPAIADLCKVMMRGHLQFEEEGDDVMRKLVDQYKHEHMEDPMTPGYAYALEDERKDMRKEAEKVRQLVEPGK